MFMSAREIESSHSPAWGDHEYVRDPENDRNTLGMVYPARRVETSGEVWDRKYREASDPAGMWGSRRYPEHGTLRNAVVAEGVKEPVTLGDPAHYTGSEPEVRNGHHRIAIMLKERPDDMIPVQTGNYYPRPKR